MFTTDANLKMQEYRLTREDRRRMRVALRFSTGLCLALIAGAAAARSVPALAVLTIVGGAAGWTARHPFDRVWNGAAGRLPDVPKIPPTPRRRRHGFKVAAVWLAATAALLAAGHTTAALVLAGGLVTACAVQTFTYLCLPSLVIAAWEERVLPTITSIASGGPR